MRTRPTVPLALFGVALLAGSLTHAPIFDYLGNPMILEFLFGVGIARLPRREQWAWPLLAASALGFALSPLGLYEHHSAIDASRSLLRVVSWGLPAAFAVYGVLCAERWFSSGWFAPLVLLGDASYSIYLFHRLTTFVPVDWPLKFLICVAFGVCIHFLVERPIIKLKPKLGARLTDAGALPEAAPAIRIST
jgi:exopolysaccharide production protein ExoZ